MLLQKIKSTGMNRHISNCLFSYLFNGGQLVLNGSGVSIYSSFVAGIHAGSPIVFFLTYINDAADVKLNNGSFINLYVDDILLYRETKCPKYYNNYVAE